MSGEKPEFEGEGPEKMMRELMAQLKQSQGLPTPYYVVKREELVAHLAERADFWRSEVEEIRSGRREVVDEIGIGRAIAVPRLPGHFDNLAHLASAEVLAREKEREQEMLEQIKAQARTAAIKNAQDRARTFAFLSKHVPKSIPEFGLDLHAARTLELIPSDLQQSHYLVGR